MFIRNKVIRSMILLCLAFAAAPVWSSPILLEVDDSANAYWIHLEVLDSTEMITAVAVRDGVNYVSWLDGVDEFSGWTFNNTGFAFSEPLSVRLTAESGEQLIFTDIISTFYGGFIFDTGQNFVSSVPAAPAVWLLGTGCLFLIAMRRQRR